MDSLIKRRKKKFFYNLSLFLLMVPGLAWIICFRFLPIPGILIAFKDYNLFKGFSQSEWVGLKYFKEMFSQPRFLNVIINTLEISLLKILILFPLPIIIALLLNEFRSRKYKKLCQVVLYLPHFLSFVVIHGVFVSILSTQGGIVNKFIVFLGLQPVNFYSNEHFREVLLLTEGYKDVGWNTIVYLSALSAIDMELYEAAEVDGASKFQQMLHITLPGIMPIIMLMLTLRLGNIMQAGTDQILVMYNPSVYKTGDVIGTFVFREGISSGQFSLSTAVGLFESVVAFILVLGTNLLTKKTFNRGLW